MSPSKRIARFAGVLYLLMAIFGISAEIFFRQKIFTSNDVTTTANNILSNIFLYRAGITSDILMALCYLLTALALYKLLCSVNKDLAAMMVIFAIVGSVLFMFNILNELAPLYILNGNDYMGTFASNQKQSVAKLFYDLYQHGYMIGQIFFALWVLPLGILIYKSGFIPRVFGILFAIEALFGFPAAIVHFLIPNGTMETLMLFPGTIAELSFMFWLLIRGINESAVLKPDRKLDIF